MNTTQSLSEDDDLRLAEYALGVLEADERHAVEMQLASEPEFVQRLEEWHAHLSPMLEEIAGQAPPEYVWTSINARLGHKAQRERVAAVKPASTLWNSLNLWRGFSAAGFAAALVMAILLVGVPPAEDDLHSAATMLSAALQLESGEIVYTATLDASRSTLVMVPAAGLRLEGRDAELWLIAGDRPPQSLGLLPAGAAVRLAIPEKLRALTDANSVFAVSLEPPGGSATGLPTGPVVAQGVLTAI